MDFGIFLSPQGGVAEYGLVEFALPTAISIRRLH
jgi:hypothetical protein